MIKASKKDRQLIIGILANSFDDNPSVNHIVPQDAKRVERIKALMAYSFDVCMSSGLVYLSNDKKGCLLVLFPDKKKIGLKSIYFDLLFMVRCIGIKNLKKTILRQIKIKQVQPEAAMFYIWFIGVYKNHQQQGIGTQLLHEAIALAENMDRHIYLETSVINNLDWYKRFGFKVYHQLHLGYNLFFLRNKN